MVIANLFNHTAVYIIFLYFIETLTNCTHGEVRLVNGLTIYEGRVELCVYGVWGTVCHNSWSAE